MIMIINHIPDKKWWSVFFQVKKAWLEMASDNHSRIFTTLLPQIPDSFILIFLYIVYNHNFCISTPFYGENLDDDY